MFSHYLFIAFQSLKKQPVFSAIKILSLAVGLVCSLLVLMHLQYIYSYDKHIPNWQNTYRLVADLNADPVIHTDISADPYMEQLALDYPEIELIARMRPANGVFARADNPLANGLHWVDPDILKIFSLNFVAGDAANALAQPNSVILNETTARKYFSDENPVGQTLRLDNRLDLNVTGVFQDQPDNTHVDFQILIAVDTARQMLGEEFMAGNDWMAFTGTRTYLTFPDQAAAAEMEANLPNFIAQHFPAAQRERANSSQLALSLEPLADIYLSPRQGFNAGIDTNAAAVSFLSLIAAVVLLTSCINFANLSISQLQQRSKEMGIKRALGARRTQIVTQILFESLAQTVLALVIALPFVMLLTPYYTAIIGEAIGVSFTPAILLESRNSLNLAIFVLATGILAGLVPAIVLSKHQPAQVLKQKNAAGKNSRYVRPAITIVQFAFAAAVIMTAFASYRQMDYMTELDVGFDMSNLVVMDTGYDPRNPDRFNYEAMKNDMAQHPGIVALATADSAPPAKGTDGAWRLASFAENDSRLVRHYTVDADYLDTMGIKLLAGRGFDSDFTTDFAAPAGNGSQPASSGDRGIVITRNALRNFGFSSPESALDQLFFLDGNAHRVIGVAEDFYFMGAIVSSLPLANVLRASTEPMRYFMLQIDPAQTRSVQDHINTVWRRHRPDAPVNQSFYQNRYRVVVGSWRTPIMSTTIFASVVTILISICGLYALAFYSTQRRIKEVGVRKVLGASRGSIVALFTWDFVKPVLIANVIACLAAYYGIRWIYGLFLFSPTVPWWLYLSVAVLTLAVAAGTVALLCFRAAGTNPVKSLRYE